MAEISGHTMPSHDSGKVDGLLMVGFGAGLYSFYRGFRTFREYQVLMGTPEIPIRSVAMGLVEVHGKATGVVPQPSPVTKTPCYFYKVEIEHWVQNKNGGNWAHLATDTDGKRFYLADTSGKVLVDAHHAEYDLLQKARVEAGRPFGSGLGRLWGGSAGSDANDELTAYAVAAVARCKGTGWFGGGGSRERYRLTEYLVIPEHWYDVTGTCVENPQPHDEDDRNMIVKGSNEPTFLITYRSEKEIRRTLRNRAGKQIFGGAILAVACLALFLAEHGAF